MLWVLRECAHQHGAGVGVYGDVLEEELGRDGVGLAVVEHDLDVAAVGLLPLAGAQRLAQREQLGAGLGEIDVDRVDLLDGGQVRRLAFAHQRSFGDERAADAPGNRRRHPGVFQIERGLGKPRFGLFPGGLGRVEFLLADGVDLHQRAVALHQELGRGNVGFGGFIGALVGTRLDAVEQLPFLHVAAFFEKALFQDAFDAGAHLSRAVGFEPAGEFAAQHGAAVAGFDHRDFGWRRGGLILGRVGVVAVAGGGQQDEGGGQGEPQRGV